MRRAAAAGLDKTFDEHPSTAALIAHLLLRAGRVEEAHGAWTEAENVIDAAILKQDLDQVRFTASQCLSQPAERPGDSWIHQAAGRGYEAAGLHDLALGWRTRACRACPVIWTDGARVRAYRTALEDAGRRARGWTSSDAGRSPGTGLTAQVSGSAFWSMPRTRSAKASAGEVGRGHSR